MIVFLSVSSTREFSFRVRTAGMKNLLKKKLKGIRFKADKAVIKDYDTALMASNLILENSEIELGKLKKELRLREKAYPYAYLLLSESSYGISELSQTVSETLKDESDRDSFLDYTEELRGYFLLDISDSAEELSEGKRNIKYLRHTMDNLDNILQPFYEDFEYVQEDKLSLLESALEPLSKGVGSYSLTYKGLTGHNLIG